MLFTLVFVGLPPLLALDDVASIVLFMATPMPILLIPITSSASFLSSYDAATYSIKCKMNDDIMLACAFIQNHL